MSLVPESPSQERITPALARAHRLILERPLLLRAREPDDYALVARHVDALETWHRAHTGWPIHYNELAGLLRLRRRPSLAPIGTWEPWKSDLVFTSPRDYACLVYLLWYARSPMVLARGGVRQVLLSDLSANLARRSALRDPSPDEPTGASADASEVEPFDFARRRADYYSLRRALKALEDLGAVNVLDEAEAGPDGVGEALIEFTDAVEALVVELDLRAVRALDAAPPFAREASILDLARGNPLERAWRTLLLGPLLLRRDDPAAFEALRARRDAIEEEAERVFGLVFDLSSGYARLVRPAGVPDAGAPLLFHQQRGLDHTGLLLCSAVRERVERGELPAPDEDGCLVFGGETLATIFDRVAEENRAFWGSNLAELKPRTLFGRVCARLRTLGLLRGPDQEGRVLLLPVAGYVEAAYPQKGSADSPGRGEAEEDRDDQLSMEL